MEFILNSKFKQNEEVKACGAKWRTDIKKWVVRNPASFELLRRFLDDPDVPNPWGTHREWVFVKFDDNFNAKEIMGYKFDNEAKCWYNPDHNTTATNMDECVIDFTRIVDFQVPGMKKAFERAQQTMIDEDNHLVNRFKEEQVVNVSTA